MSVSPPAPSAGPRSGGLEALVGKRREVGTGFVVVGAAVAIIPLYCVFKYGVASINGDVAPYTVWGALVALTFMAGGLYHMNPSPRSKDSELDQLRFLFLMVGTVAGFLTALLGLALPVYPASYRKVFTSPLSEWRAHYGVVLRTAAALVGGLVLMFLSVQLARTFERSHASRRRLLYGTTAAVEVMLLVLGLILFNLLPYTDLPGFKSLRKIHDWTKSGIYTISPATENVLHELQEPVKVYVLLRSEGEDAGLTNDVEALMQGCQSVSSQFTYEMVSPDRLKRVEELEKKYVLPDRLGLLVVYGAPNNETSDFIRRSDLEGRDSSGNPAFTGEEALRKSLDYLKNNKRRLNIYFTAGQGELSGGGGAPGGGAETDVDRMSLLWGRLNRGNYELKTLALNQPGAKVPDDADVVVVARPTAKFSPDGVAALSRYMEGDSKGKLVVLMDPERGEDGGMLQTGIEPLLARFGARVDNRRLLSMQRFPDLVVAVTVPRMTGPSGATRPNPIGSRFNSEEEGPVQFPFVKCRAVDPAPEGAGQFSVAVLAESARGLDVWREESMSVNALDTALAMATDAALARRKGLTGQPQPVAVMVSERRGGGFNPHMPSSGGEAPRLVVFGSAAWLSDRYFRGGGAYSGDLFITTVSWLRERPDLGVSTTPGKTRGEYTMKTPREQLLGLIFLPGMMSLMLIIGAGLGVWLVRRR